MPHGQLDGFRFGKGRKMKCVPEFASGKAEPLGSDVGDAPEEFRQTAPNIAEVGLDAPVNDLERVVPRCDFHQGHAGGAQTNPQGID
jgi:hypothetical protein